MTCTKCGRHILGVNSTVCTAMLQFPESYGLCQCPLVIDATAGTAAAPNFGIVRCDNAAAASAPGFQIRFNTSAGSR